MSLLDTILARAGYVKKGTFEKANKREGYSYDPLAMAYSQMNRQFGIKKASNITFQTLRRMSRANWVDRTCITTLRDEITGIKWDIVPKDGKKPYNENFQKNLIQLLKKPNKNKENWRTLIDKVVEDILVVDGGCIEKVRDGKGRIMELWHVDGATVKPLYDDHGIAGDIAYQQFLPNQKSQDPVAEWNNDDLIYMMWNPQGAVDTFGYGMSPVEAGLAVGTAFLYAEAYNMGFFNKNTIPPMIINMGKDIPPAEVDKFKIFLAQEMMGEAGFHTPIVGSFGDGFSAQDILKAPGDMAWEKYVEWQMRWKVALYRMSPQDIGFTLDQYKVEGEIQQQLSKNKAINSLKGVIKEYIDTEIVNDPGWMDEAENLEFGWIDDMVVDPLKQAQVDEIYLRTGVNKINEIRVRRGDDPVDGGDKPMIVVGSTLMPVKPELVEQQLQNQTDATAAATKQLKDGKDEDGKDTGKHDEKDKKKDTPTKTEKSFEKHFTPEESQIVSLAENQTAIAWMDDRGVNQPLYITDYGRTKGFQIKSAFLDDARDQEPPEQYVAEVLRLLKVNTPEVHIMKYDEVLRLLPEHLYRDFTAWINLDPPYNSQAWRERWGKTRASSYYMVAGYLPGRDLGNEDLQRDMALNPGSYKDAVRDLARVWLAEKRFYLGDRKPGHYIVTNTFNGYGVDYQFYQTEDSWRTTSHWLPEVLRRIHEQLYKMFEDALKDEYAAFERIEKAFLPNMHNGREPIVTVEQVDQKLAQIVQGKIARFYKKIVRTSKARPVQKANDFNLDDDYLVDGEFVYQNNVRFPISVLPEEIRPSPDDLILKPADYAIAFRLGSGKAASGIRVELGNDIKLRAPELYAPQFERRAQDLADSMYESMRDAVRGAIVKGIDEGKTYGDIADMIRQAVGVDPDNLADPKWRAERIARTESQWAINEGMREQYKLAGLQKINISVANTACDICIQEASHNPYNVSDEGILPCHPNCRCSWVADYSDVFKSFEKSQYDYQSTQLDVPEVVASKIAAFANRIPKEELNQEDGGIETDAHITVLYGLGDGVDETMLVGVLKGQPKVDVELGELSIFSNETCDVLKVGVRGDAIHLLHNRLKNAVSAPGNLFDTYIPHLTIAYLKKGEGKKYIGNKIFAGEKITFDTLTYSKKEGRKVMIPLA